MAAMLPVGLVSLLDPSVWPTQRPSRINRDEAWLLLWFMHPPFGIVACDRGRQAALAGHAIMSEEEVIRRLSSV
jgi:hypothetical protein